MRQATYLNVILTINAGLLTGLLWGQLAGGSLLSSSASAQSLSSSGNTTGQSAIPVTAADQRQRQIEILRDLKSSVDSLKKTVEGGIKVEVSNIDELKTQKP